MKALVLSGGTGSRLRPLTYTSAKQLIPVANKPILFYAIESILEAGIRDFGIVVGETGDEVRAAVGDGSRWGIKVTYIEQDAPRGLAHAVKIAEPYLGQESFIMFLGDNLVKAGVTQFVRRFDEGRPNALILLSRVPDPQRFGVAELRDGRVVRLVEKPRVPPSDLALVGVYLFDHHIQTAVNSIQPSGRGELEITDAIQWLVEHGYLVEPHLVNDWWKDTGKPEDVLEANRLVLELLQTNIRGSVSEDSRVIGRAVIEAGARITGSVIRGPAVIGPGSVISNSYIGPFTSIGPEVTVADSEIESSIVLEGSTISGVQTRIDGSLIGKNVTITRAEGKPRAIKLVLGDNSQASLA